MVVAGDSRHSNILLNEWGMVNCRGLDTPLGKEAESEEDKKTLESKGNPMNEVDARKYRRGTARVNFMSQDRLDLSVASRLMSQNMATPKEGDEKMLKRVIRYLRRYPVSKSRFDWQERPGVVTVNIDSDWAGDKTTRKSASGGTILHGKHLINHWSKLQSTVALSSGEAELNAAVKGTSEGIGLKEMISSLGEEVKLEILTDASVCKSILLRHGCGKIKHLSTKQLWVQGAIESYAIKVFKIPRNDNPADLLTHGCTKVDHERHLKNLSQDVKAIKDDFSEEGCK